MTTAKADNEDVKPTTEMRVRTSSARDNQPCRVDVDSNTHNLRHHRHWETDDAVKHRVKRPIERVQHSTETHITARRHVQSFAIIFTSLRLSSAAMTQTLALPAWNLSTHAARQLIFCQAINTASTRTKIDTWCPREMSVGRRAA